MLRRKKKHNVVKPYKKRLDFPQVGEAPFKTLLPRRLATSLEGLLMHCIGKGVGK